jgi:hypothetical protein
MWGRYAETMDCLLLVLKSGRPWPRASPKCWGQPRFSKPSTRERERERERERDLGRSAQQEQRKG